MASHPKKAVEKKEEFAKASDVKAIADAVGALADVIKEMRTSSKETSASPEKVQAIQDKSEHEAAVEKAKAFQAPINPEWEAKAQEILGGKLDHCEVLYPKQGGIMFTVVIKPQFSNAPAEYLKRHKHDRRTKEIGNEGIEGVENWCKLVRDNLKKGR